MTLRIIITAIVGYLLGNLNGAVLISRLVAHDDVRQHGSGNAGLTNFVRNYGGASSLIVLLIDALKAIAACFLGRILLADFGFSLEGASIGGLAVIIGHIFPVFLGFKGGKGIVSGAAAFAFIDWRCALPALALFILIYACTQYVSLSSIAAAACIAIVFSVLHYTQSWALIPALAACALAIIMHRENIVRLMKGTERKTNFFKRGKKG